MLRENRSQLEIYLNIEIPEVESTSVDGVIQGRYPRFAAIREGIANATARND